MLYSEQPWAMALQEQTNVALWLHAGWPDHQVWPASQGDTRSMQLHLFKAGDRPVQGCNLKPESWALTVRCIARKGSTGRASVLGLQAKPDMPCCCGKP